MIVGGRSFLRRLIDLLVGKNARRGAHRIYLNNNALSDIDWWIRCMSFFNGSMPFNCDIPEPSSIFASDACLEAGAAFFNGDWLYARWKCDFPSWTSDHINVLELKTVLLATLKWGRCWSGRHILVRSDNMATVAAINHTTCKSPAMMSTVRDLFWLSTLFKFKLSAMHLPGHLNVLCDRLSRLHELKAANDARILLSGSPHGLINSFSHMSFKTFISLLQDRHSWIKTR